MISFYVDQAINPGGQLPEYQTSGAAAFDLCATEPMLLMPLQRHLFKTGLKMSYCPDGLAVLICSRSGMSLKSGLMVLNSPGICDQDYLDSDFGVILMNLSDAPVQISPGQRIAQAMIIKVSRDSNISIKDTVRSGGFGSTNS